METLLPALSALMGLALLATALWLVRAPSVYLLSLHVLSRVVLDSAAEVTYQPVVAGLSLMQLYSVAFIGLAGLHLLWQRRLEMHAYTWPLLAVVGAALLSTAIYRNWDNMVAPALRWAYLWVLIALTLSALAQGSGRQIMGSLAFAGLYAFGNLAYSVITDQPKWGAGQWSYIGTYAHESDVSFLMIMLIIPGLYLLCRQNAIWKTLAGTVCIAAAHIGLAYAAYRSLWVATAGFWAFFTWTRYLRGTLSRRALWIGASVGGLFLATVLLGPSIFEKMTDLSDFAANPSQYLDFSGDARQVDLMSGRVNLINAYMAIYLNSGVHVWAAGIGPGRGADVVGLYAHNEYLSALVETGIIGLAALLLLLARITRDSLAAVRLDDPLGQVMAPYLMVIIVASLGTMPFQDMRAMMTLGIVLGFLVHFATAGSPARPPAARFRRAGPEILDLTPTQALR